MARSSNVHVMIPGEQLVHGKPWLRKVDGQVVRYVRGSVEDGCLIMLRTIGGPRNADLDRALNRNAERLTTHLDYLRSTGVPVVRSTVTVEEVPYFERCQKEPRSYQLGIKVVSDYLTGRKLEDTPRPAQPDVASTIDKLHSDLETYARDSVAAGEPFLGDVYGAWKYLMTDLGQEQQQDQPTLVDTDPLFISSTQANLDRVLRMIEDQRQGFVPPS